jgi:uncharacterized protein with PCYCGC motif
MKKNWLLILGIALALVVVVLVVNSSNQSPVTAIQNADQSAAQTPVPRHEHSSSTAAKAVPAHFDVAPSRSSLGPTLDPGSFSGVTRDAYRAVKEIPVTIAQLPCYCHCDQGFGHKSLYSCFEDDHAAHCAVCVQEALLALKLEKEQKMTPAQIRDTIMAQYSQ